VADLSRIRDLLFVEDEPLIQMDVEIRLEYMRIGRVHSVASCEQGLAIIRKHSVDMALLDIILGGGEDCTMIADVLFARSVPIIFCSGANDPSWLERYPGSLWIDKPVTDEQLAGALMQATLMGT
jgi:DNA-binding NtrC family response regulator